MKSVLTTIFALHFLSLSPMESTSVTVSHYEKQQIAAAFQYRKNSRGLEFRTSIKKLQRMFPEKINAHVAQEIQKPLTKLFIDCSIATLIMSNKSHKKVVRKNQSDTAIKHACIDAIKTLHDMHRYYGTFVQKNPLRKRHVIEKCSDNNRKFDNNAIVPTLTLELPNTQKLRTYLINATRSAEITAIHYFAKDKDFIAATHQQLQDLYYYNRLFILMYNIDDINDTKGACLDESLSCYRNDKDVVSPPRKRIKTSHIYTPAQNDFIADPEILNSPKKLSAIKASIRNEIVTNFITCDISDALHIDTATTNAFISSVNNKITAYYIKGSPEEKSIRKLSQHALDLFQLCKEYNRSLYFCLNAGINALVRLLNKQLAEFINPDEANEIEDLIGMFKKYENDGILPYFKVVHNNFFILQRQYYENMVRSLTRLLRNSYRSVYLHKQITHIANILRRDYQSGGPLSQHREVRDRYRTLKNIHREII